MAHEILASIFSENKIRAFELLSTPVSSKLPLASMLIGSAYGFFNICRHILKKPYADPISIEASGNLDETGVDSNSKARILFSENIEANISCAINEVYENNLEIISGDYKLSVTEPWFGNT